MPLPRVLLALLFGLGLGLAPAVARADDEPRCEEVRPGLVLCAETRVEGRVASSFYVLTRSPIRHRARAPRGPDMARAVTASVQQRPF